MVGVHNQSVSSTTWRHLSTDPLTNSFAYHTLKTGATDDQMEEAKSINLSLSALGNVFNALSTGANFVPYNDNKLTQLMRDSLGGDAKTLMFVNLSPAGE